MTPMTNLYGLQSPLTTTATTTTPSSPGAADPALVQQFEAAMAPRTAAASTPTGTAFDVTGLPQATDQQLARLPPAQLERLRNRWGDDDAHLRVEAKVMLDLIEKPVQQQIMKDIRKMFQHRDD